MQDIEVTSPAFDDGEDIPIEYSCDGQNISPPIEWSGFPGNTESFAIIMDDPDAPGGTFIHWVIFNIPVNVTSLPEDVVTHASLENGALQGKNDARSIGYTGPCPPRATHRYRFHVYALDARLNIRSGITAPELHAAMKGHIIGEGELSGKYARK